MQEVIHQLDELRSTVQNYFNQARAEEISHRPSPTKWSKKEVLGHLIDSGVNNLRRFTEIQFMPKPYKIISYNQTGLVTANYYQDADIVEIMDFWVSINQRINKVIEKLTTEALTYKIELPNGNMADLHFLITDYVDHMAHHVNQIVDLNRV